jgi:hypothetical protein
VIGFYFGSRSAEVARDKAAGAAEPNELAAQALDADLKAFDTALADGSVRLNALKADTPPPEAAAAFGAALSLLLPAAAGLAADRAALTATLAEARSQKLALAPLQARADALKVALADFKDKLAAAERLVAQG